MTGQIQIVRGAARRGQDAATAGDVGRRVVYIFGRAFGFLLRFECVHVLESMGAWRTDVSVNCNGISVNVVPILK